MRRIRRVAVADKLKYNKGLWVKLFYNMGLKG